jgi:trehalose 6-phosphate phosphatase
MTKKSHVNPPPAASLDWAYFLDVDGTLIQLADTPQAVVIDQTLRDMIGRLHRACGGAVALVSGRMISDLQARIKLPQLALAGLHGLERRDSTGRLWLYAAPPSSKSTLINVLAPVLARHPGLLLEDKGLTLALHYRQAPQLAAYVHRLMKRLCHASEGNLELQCGKFVVEIKPAGVHKGSAISEYLSESPFKGRRPVFIGDDQNDEHGFAEINRRDGVSIKVGKGPSCARFRLPDVASVHQWLGSTLIDQQSHHITG